MGVYAGQRIIYETGQKIGNCTYLEDVVVKHGARKAKFKCECGEEFTASIYKVKILHTRSCGCLHRRELTERNTKHGLRHLVEYSLWLNMKQRCTNPNFINFKDWGGRGITMCERWINSFENFYEDMGSQPAKRMGIDRVNNELGYSKENCRWATQKQQNNNKRNNKVIEYMGRTQTLSQWCEELGLVYSRIFHRFSRGGKSIHDIFTIEKYSNNGKPIKKTA